MQEPLPRDFEKYVSEDENGVWTIKDGAPPDVVEVFNDLYRDRHLIRDKLRRQGYDV